MAHATQGVTSYQDAEPLREVTWYRRVGYPPANQYGGYGLGAFTGTRMAVCAYAGPTGPALVAYDYSDGAIRWMSAPDDLHLAPRREVSALLLARTKRREGVFDNYVFASNPVEFVAYSADGATVWRRHVSDVVPAAGRAGIGGPVSLNLSAAGEIVTATDEGWVVMLDGGSGRAVAAQRLEACVREDGRTYRGTFVSPKSLIVVGDVAYLAGVFRPNATQSLAAHARPVYMLRIDLAAIRAGRPAIDDEIVEPSSPRAVRIGRYRAGGSPCALVTNGKTLVVANSHRDDGNVLKPALTAVEDDGRRLAERWSCVLDTAADEQIHAAPAMHHPTATLIVNTSRALHVLRNVDTLDGTVPAPTPIPAELLVRGLSVCDASRVGIGTPLAITCDEPSGSIVAYTCARISRPRGSLRYGWIIAFELPVESREARPAVPLWCRPLGIEARSHLPGPGTFGQPALFRYSGANGEATGLIVNTARSGTYLAT